MIYVYFESSPHLLLSIACEKPQFTRSRINTDSFDTDFCAPSKLLVGRWHDRSETKWRDYEESAGIRGKVNGANTSIIMLRDEG
jgi:hypothetical protein